MAHRTVANPLCSHQVFALGQRVLLLIHTEVAVIDLQLRVPGTLLMCLTVAAEAWMTKTSKYLGLCSCV
ncbi:hypothetical protein JOB18_008576 [Solea senegalensis]|uniref:Uncharacterized protein n=1 Tax=Solea senegalensis TaxID=28829 RepID=A0AAV6R3U5_SOLSE|nr:hypothetical protein JOB18_008576 [Solea senegalensis]KAG7500094.1 hypothetical protein JOB18_008576 [Solea senegalensis]